MKGPKIILQLLLPVVLLISCNSAKEKQDEKDTTVAVVSSPVKPDSIAIKASWAVEKFARQDLQMGGYKILSLEIDSFSYKMVSMKDYYTDRKAMLEKEKQEYRAVNLKLKQSGVAVNQTKLSDDSIKTANAIKVLDQELTKASDEKNVICATYKLVAQTNTTAYNTVYTKYLLKKDFTEIKMKFQDVSR